MSPGASRRDAPGGAEQRTRVTFYLPLARSLLSLANEVLLAVAAPTLGVRVSGWG